MRKTIGQSREVNQEKLTPINITTNANGFATLFPAITKDSNLVCRYDKWGKLDYAMMVVCENVFDMNEQIKECKEEEGKGLSWFSSPKAFIDKTIESNLPKTKQPR